MNVTQKLTSLVVTLSVTWGRRTRCRNGR